MNIALFDNNFIFNKIKFKNYHYTDHTMGSPLNYLAYMIKGRAKIVSDKKTLTINEGDVFYIPLHLPYESYWYGEEIVFLSFGFSELFTPENEELTLQIVPCDNSLKEKISSLPYGEVNCQALSSFYGIMSEIIPIMERSSLSKKDMIMRTAVSYINTHPDCSVSEIAEACYISEPYVYVLFREKLSCTPNEYRQNQLVKKGVELLVRTDKKVEEISVMLNYSSASYFRKQIKKHFGMSPREIRKNSAKRTLP